MKEKPEPRARPKNLKVASAQPVTEYVDIIPDIIPNTTGGKLKFLAWLRRVLKQLPVVFKNFRNLTRMLS